MPSALGRGHRQECPPLLKYDTVQVSHISISVSSHLDLVAHLPTDSGRITSFKSFSQLQKKYGIVSKKVQLEVSDMTGNYCM